MSDTTTRKVNNQDVDTPRKQPNVITIIMDDLAYGDLACHGNPYTKTPNLDKLYSQSTRLTRYWSGPLSTPARASLMTGRYPYRTAAIDTYCGRSIMHPDEVTLAEMLKDANYRTGIFGKWHLGDCYPSRAMDKGFEEALVHNGGGLRQPANIGNDSYFDPDLLHNGKLKASKGYCTDVFTDAAIDYINEHQDEPFFVYLATNAPHSPFEIDDKWVEPYRKMGLNETFARVYGMVENIDMNVGRIMDELDKLNLADDTILIYTSDHGPCGSAHHEGEIRFNANLRSIKGTVYGGGIQVPCFWRWPKHFQAGLDIDRIANPIDIMPTLASVCGAKLPDDRTIDGRDISSLLTGERANQDWPDRTLFMQWHRGDVPKRYNNYAVFEQQYKLCRPEEKGAAELYDINIDPEEKKDIASQHVARVNWMRQQYDQWFDDVSATRGDETYLQPLIHIGTQHESPTPLTRQDWRIHEDADGWDDLRQAHWQVLNTTQGDYQATVRFTTTKQAAKVFLQVDDRCFEQAVEGGQNVCEFIVSNWPKGPSRIESWVQMGGQKYAGQRIDLVIKINE